MDGIWEHLHHWVAPLCHQLPERTMSAGQLQAPLCLRCSAFYVSFLFALVFMLATKRTRAISAIPALVVAVAATGVMACDALLWPSHNVLRHMTGILAGLGVALVAGSTLARTLDLGSESGRTWVVWSCLPCVGACVALLYPWSLTGARAPVVASALGSSLGLLVLAFTANALIVGTWVSASRQTPALAFGLLVLELVALVAFS